MRTCLFLLPPSSELLVCPELSTSPVVPLSDVLPVLGVAIWCVWAAHTSPESLESHKSPSPHPQPTICAVGSPWVCQSSSASWLENHLSPPPASEFRIPPLLFDPSAPPWLLAPSSLPWPISPLAPPGFHIPPTQPLSVVDHPSLRDTTPLAAPHPSGSSRLLLLVASISVLSLQLHRGLPDPRLRLGCLSHLLRLGPPYPPCRPGLSALRLRLGLLHHRQSAPWIRQT